MALVILPDGTRAFICGPAMKDVKDGSFVSYPRCSHVNAYGDQCAAPGDVLCDYPTGSGETCSKQLCGHHSVHVGPEYRNTDYCNVHAMELGLKHECGERCRFLK